MSMGADRQRSERKKGSPTGRSDAGLPSLPVTLDLTVRFAETDQMGVVHHSAYIIWFEAGRIAWMAAGPLPYEEIADAGFNFAVTEIESRYRNPIRFGEPVQVATRLISLRSREIEFDYRVQRVLTGDTGPTARKEICAVGRSRHICVDCQGAVARIPDWVVAGLRTGVGRLAHIESRER